MSDFCPKNCHFKVFHVNAKKLWRTHWLYQKALKQEVPSPTFLQSNVVLHDAINNSQIKFPYSKWTIET